MPNCCTCAAVPCAPAVPHRPPSCHLHLLQGHLATAVVACSCHEVALPHARSNRPCSPRRRRYRESRGCIEIPLPEAKIHVPREHLDRVRPAVTITRVSQWDSPSRNLVAEMMILAGEAVGTIGERTRAHAPGCGGVGAGQRAVLQLLLPRSSDT